MWQFFWIYGTTSVLIISCVLSCDVLTQKEETKNDGFNSMFSKNIIKHKSSLIYNIKILNWKTFQRTFLKTFAKDFKIMEWYK